MRLGTLSGVLAVLCLTTILGAPGIGAAGEYTISVPNDMPVGKAVVVSMTGLNNTTFRLGVSSLGSGYNYYVQGTFGVGPYYAEITLPAEGEYLFTLEAGNETVTRTVKGICDADCQRNRMAELLTLIEGHLTQWVGALVFIVVSMEIARYVEMERVKAEWAKALSIPLPRGRLWRKGSRMRLVVAPNLAAQRADVNPRLGYQREKDSVLEAIRELSSPRTRPIGYDPDWEYKLVGMFRDYVVAHKNLVDSLAGPARTLIDDADKDIEATMSVLKNYVVPNPEEAPPPPAGWKDNVPRIGRQHPPPPPDERARPGWRARRRMRKASEKDGLA